MKAVVFKGVGNIALEHVEDPKIVHATDAIVKITTSAICGTDLHFIRGTVPSVAPGTILGHEGVGIIEQIGTDVAGLAIGDRVVIPSTISCGTCFYCSKGDYSQCDTANPHGPHAGTSYFGGTLMSGPFNGLQAEKARIPFAQHSLIKLPKTVSDEQAILLSDVIPTAYMAVELADVQPDDTVAVFGCGPIGQLAIACLNLLNVKTIFAIDCVPERLALAQQQGARIINFNVDDPVEMLYTYTSGRGPTKAIDAVGIDAHQPDIGTIGFFKNQKNIDRVPLYKKELECITLRTNPHDGNWIPGNAPSQALDWAVEALAKVGTLSVVGVYTPLMNFFAIGHSMNKNLTIRLGNCNHRKYIPRLLDLVMNGSLDPRPFITTKVPFDQAIEAYKLFDKRENGCLKVMLSLD